MMDIRIYQVNLRRDENQVAFIGLERLSRFQGTADINSQIYDKVYEGAAEGSNLEDVYRQFNLDRPEGYRGRSLSVSDVVEVVSGGEASPGFYFCDSIGFQPVEFHPEQVQEKQRTIRVVLLEPGKVARVTDIDASLAGMQKVVGGDIEPVYPFEEEVCIVGNEEGKILGLPLNRALRMDGKVYDILAGTQFICDCSGENFGSLTEEQQRKYREMFRYPERFFRIGNEIGAVPYKPQNKDHER